jgi:hypothetical protein
MGRTELQLYYGKWDSGIDSKKIFSIYHIQEGPKVWLDYESRAAVNAKERSAAIPVILLSLALVGIAVHFGIKRGMKIREAAGRA